MVAAFRAFRARPRLLASIVVAGVLAAVLPSRFTLSARLLIGWDAGTILYLVLAFLMMASSDVASMRRRAATQDDGAFFILFVTSFGAVASLGAIAMELLGAGGEPHGKGLRMALAAVTILCSWLFVHLSFALHYAHEFYGEGRDAEMGGLEFPKKDYEPDYWDFLYFSANLGAAAQTSDIMITSPAMRRLVLAHTILSFLFNTMILALGVNVGASLLSSS